MTLPESQEMEVGSTMSLTPVFTSDVPGVQPTYQDVKWSSSNPAVATVNETTGEITAIASGQTNITATTSHSYSVPSGSAQKSATCALTVKASENPINVGDFYYSDGTWSSELNTSKTVIGVVFAKANATTSDALLAKDYPGCTHGLVLSLVEYTEQDFGDVSCYNGHGYYAGLGFDAASIVDTERVNGYGNTLAHKTLNAEKSTYCTIFNAANGIVAQHTSAVAAPSKSSAWYIPSFKEMKMINDSRAVINTSIAKASGTKIADPYEAEESFDSKRTSDWYWTSTIYGKPYTASFDHYKYAFDISKGTWTTYQQSSTKCKVRVVLAF